MADYVRQNASKMVGFAGIDPNDRDWREELRLAQEELQLKGVMVSPSMQDYHPSDTLAMRLYEECVRRNMPVVFDQQQRSAAAKMEFARQCCWMRWRVSSPTCASSSRTWAIRGVEETVVLLGKHRHVYADIAGLHRQPWLAYTVLLTAHEYGVMDKLLFASGFPNRSPPSASRHCIP